MQVASRRVVMLSDSVDMILRSKNRQIMLSQIHADREFGVFLHGQEAVQVITPSRKIFLATMTPLGDAPGEYILTPVADRPKLEQGDSLLLLFQYNGQTAISQASFKSGIGSSIRVTSVDPRENIRYRTKVRVRWDVINNESFERLSNKEITFAREECEVKVGDVETISLIRDHAQDFEGREVSAPDLLFSPSMAHGLMTDISLGGTCIMVKSNERLDAAKTNMFVMIECVIPHFERDYRFELVGVVRRVRDWGLTTALHCMFVERLRADQLFV